MKPPCGGSRRGPQSSSSPPRQPPAAVLGAGVGIAEDRVVIVPEGADHLPDPDHPAAEALLERLGVPGPYLLTVSTLEPRKNLVRLVRGVRARQAEAAGALAAPGRGAGRMGALELVDAPGSPRPAESSSRRGRRRRAGAAVYSGATCCAYVPIVEGFGLPVVEAMAQGTPVVSSPVPSAGGASLEVDPTDVSSIADGLVAAAVRRNDPGSPFRRRSLAGSVASVGERRGCPCRNLGAGGRRAPGTPMSRDSTDVLQVIAGRQRRSGSDPPAPGDTSSSLPQPSRSSPIAA